MKSFYKWRGPIVRGGRASRARRWTRLRIRCLRTTIRIAGICHTVRDISVMRRRKSGINMHRDKVRITHIRIRVDIRIYRRIRHWYIIIIGLTVIVKIHGFYIVPISRNRYKFSWLYCAGCGGRRLGKFLFDCGRLGSRRGCTRVGQ